MIIYGVQHIRFLEENWPGLFWSTDPLIYTDYHIRREGTSLILSRRATDAFGRPLAIVHLEDGHDFRMNTTSNSWYTILQPNGKYGTPQDMTSLSNVQTDLVKDRNETGILPEASFGYNWDEAFAELRKCGCLEAYAGDFLYHNRRSLLVDEDPTESIFLTSPHGSFRNTKRDMMLYGLRLFDDTSGASPYGFYIKDGKICIAEKEVLRKVASTIPFVGGSLCQEFQYSYFLTGNVRVSVYRRAGEFVQHTMEEVSNSEAIPEYAALPQPYLL